MMDISTLKIIPKMKEQPLYPAVMTRYEGDFKENYNKTLKMMQVRLSKQLKSLI